MSELEEFVRQCGKMFAKSYCRIITNTDMSEAVRIKHLEKLFKFKEQIEKEIEEKVNKKVKIECDGK